MTPRMTGRILRIIRDKGFGFLRGEDGLNRFFEAKQVIPAMAFDLLYEGQYVTFTPTQVLDNPKGNGLRALQVEAQ